MAAGYQASLQPPQPFRFDTPDEWPKWRRRFEQFRVASGLSKEDEERQASTLLYCLGEEADDVLTSTNISTEDRKKYKQVLAKFDAHFKVRKNIIFERARFNRRMQEEEESVEQFITSLYSLADNCEYGNMKEELIRDRLVVGIKDVTLSERLQMDEALTIDKAKKSVRQREAVKEQQSFLKREETSLDYVKSKDNSSRPHKRTNNHQATTSWNIQVKVNGKAVLFVIDTGAEVSAISRNVYEAIGQPRLYNPNKILCGPGRQVLNVLGCCTVKLSYKQHRVSQKVYVVHKLANNLLGLPAIIALNVLTQVNAVQSVDHPIADKFPDLFHGLGTMKDEYEIKLKPDAKPYSLFSARRVPIPMREKVKTELQQMEAAGVISKVDGPTSWCAGMVVVPKKSGEVRICVDLKPLNENVLRETHPMPHVDDALAQLSGAKLFSKLDANSGFWQVPLAKCSRPLTTFITPFGRYWFNKLPFGISSAPEIFQRKMSATLEGIPGVLCHLDDVLVYGKDNQEHDSRLTVVLERIRAAGITLNPTKCEFAKTQLTFLGHLITHNGISADPAKTLAIKQMPPPNNVTELRRFLGMTNQLGKFSPNLSDFSAPLRKLLSHKQAWLWGPDQEQSYQKLQSELTTPTVLRPYNPQANTKISADASSYGIGAVLLQQADKNWLPVAYASRAMSTTESRYAQIEKEALAITWACEKFSTYVLGKKILLETDHKPLVPLMTYKHLDNLPPRVLRFRLRLMRFDYQIAHVPGKYLYTADTLSRSPLPTNSNEEIHRQQEEVEHFIQSVTLHLPASKERLDTFKQHQAEDTICSKLITYLSTGWPNKCSLPDILKPYWAARGNLSLHDDLLLYGSRIVIPATLQKQVLQKVHHGHQGIQRFRLRIASSVWWPGVSKAIERYIKNCSQCVKSYVPPKEPLITSPLPTRPWQKLAADLFELNKSHYLIIVDYFSRYPEVIKLTSTTSVSIINVLKSIFARHGIPSTLITDNGPQFSSSEFKKFASVYSFQHITSSPRYPQSNGLVERAVGTAKGLLQNTSDPHLALLSFRATPLPWCSLSPAELLFGRKISTDLPQSNGQLIPQWPYLEDFRRADKEHKATQQLHYNSRHRTRPLPSLAPDDPVWVRTGNNQVPGRVIMPSASPRSYIISTPTGDVRRNRYHLTPRRETDLNPETDLDLETFTASSEPSVDEPPVSNIPRSPIRTWSHTGTVVRPPSRFTS